MKREEWKAATPARRQVTYTCHERTTKSGDITAQVAGKESFHVHLDVPFPMTRQQVETLFAAELLEDA